MDIEIRSLLHQAAETRSFGRHLATVLAPGDWVAIVGDLGAGKTTLVSGLVEGIHPGSRGRSPTYVMVELYGSRPRLIHVDLYRLESPEAFDSLGIEDLMDAEEGIVLIEWADRALDRLPDVRLDLELRYPAQGAGRELRIRPHGERFETAAREGLFDRARWSHALFPGD